MITMCRCPVRSRIFDDGPPSAQKRAFDGALNMEKVTSEVDSSEKQSEVQKRHEKKLKESITALKFVRECAHDTPDSENSTASSNLTL